jgi:hypothetical protein
MAQWRLFDVADTAAMSLDFSAVIAPFRMQPGLRKLEPGRPQLTPLAPGSPVFAEKLGVLARHAGQALVSAEHFDASPALRALCKQAAAEHPQAFDSGPEGFAAHRLGWRVDGQGSVAQADGAHAAAGACLLALPAPLRLPALLCLALHEDFAVIDGRNGTVPWLAVCLPSRWSPAEKVDRHFSEIHAPVADNTTLLAAASHLMKLVCAPQRWERFVWTLTPHARHDEHPARHPPYDWPADAGADALAAATWLRSERQTFIPLPEHEQAVFTIHVDVQPLAQAVTTREQAQRLHDALASMSDAVLAYRHLGEARVRLLDWLAQRAA